MPKKRKTRDVFSSNHRILIMTKPSSAINKNIGLAVYLLFLATGASGLVYQVVWQRYLLNIFGSTIYSISTVLAAFMGGLALGSVLMGALVPRIRRCLPIYGLLEIVVGISALLIPFMLSMMDPVFTWSYQTFGSQFTMFSLLRFVMIFIILLIPTTMMGATLPLLSKFVSPESAGAGLRVGLLYALNTWGAVAGTFLTGFYFIPQWGVSHTVWFAVSINLICGLLAFLISRKIEKNIPLFAPKEPAAATANATSTNVTSQARHNAMWILAAYTISGFAALGLEVAWTRALVFSFEFLKNTTYAFTGMLTTFLIGLAIGSALMTFIVERIRRPFQVFAILQIIIGMSAFVSVFILFYVTPTCTDNLFSQFDTDSAAGIVWSLSVLDVFIKTALSMFLPTFCMGLAFPLAVKTIVDEIGEPGKSVARLYAYNTVGSILGSFSVGFILLPILGICKTIFLLGALQLFMGAILIYISRQTEQIRRITWITIAVLITVVCFVRLPKQTNFQQDTKLEKIIYYKEGPLATVSVGENSLGYRMIYVDNVGVAGTDPMLLTDQKSLAHVPMLLLEKPESVLTVGFGSGGASYSYTLYPELKDIHCVEITKTVIEASPYLVDSHRDVVMQEDMYRARTGIDLKTISGSLPLFADKKNWDGWYKSDPRYKIILDDARSYLHFSEKKYDVIATDCTDLRYKSNANLYDLEYFQLCHDRITDDGMVVVWMPMGGLSPAAFNCALYTFQKVFPEMEVFFMNNQPTHYVLLLGKKGPVKVNLDILKERIKRPAVARDLEEIQLAQPEKLLSCFVTGRDALNSLLEGSEVNTGDNPYLEFESPRFGIADAPVLNNLDSLFQRRENPSRLVANPQSDVDFMSRLQKYYDAAPFVIAGHRAYRELRLGESCEQYMKAKEITPDDASLAELLNYDELQRRIKGRPYDMWARLQLASAYTQQHRDQEAVTEYMQALDVMKDLKYAEKSEETKDKKEILSNLVTLYYRNGQADKAKELQTKIDALK